MRGDRRDGRALARALGKLAERRRGEVWDRLPAGQRALP